MTQNDKFRNLRTNPLIKTDIMQLSFQQFFKNEINLQVERQTKKSGNN